MCALAPPMQSANCWYLIYGYRKVITNAIFKTATPNDAKIGAPRIFRDDHSHLRFAISRYCEISGVVNPATKSFSNCSLLKDTPVKNCCRTVCRIPSLTRVEAKSFPRKFAETIRSKESPKMFRAVYTKTKEVKAVRAAVNCRLLFSCCAISFSVTGRPFAVAAAGLDWNPRTHKPVCTIQSPSGAALFLKRGPQAPKSIFNSFAASACLIFSYCSGLNLCNKSQASFSFIGHERKYESQLNQGEHSHKLHQKIQSWRTTVQSYAFAAPTQKERKEPVSPYLSQCSQSWEIRQIYRHSRRKAQILPRKMGLRSHETLAVWIHSSITERRQRANSGKGTSPSFTVLSGNRLTRRVQWNAISLPSTAKQQLETKRRPKTCLPATKEETRPIEQLHSSIPFILLPHFSQQERRQHVWVWPRIPSNEKHCASKWNTGEAHLSWCWFWCCSDSRQSLGLEAQCHDLLIEH